MVNTDRYNCVYNYIKFWGVLSTFTECKVVLRPKCLGTAVL